MFFTDPAVPAISPTEARDRAEDGALLVDVREPDEWREARIPGAVLKPMSTIDDWWQDLPRDREIVFYCRTGARSGQVVKALIQQAGFDNVVNMRGGILTWNEDELPIIRAGEH